MMDIKNKPTLEEKQTFWAEQLPNFEAKYWLPSHFELLEFDMEGGNYEVRHVLPEHYSEDDADDIYHRVNSGWAMWKKAINFTKAQAVPYESCSTKSHEIIINETKNELINGYDIVKEDEYLLESLVYRGVCIGEAQAVPEGFVLINKKNTEDWYLDESEGLWMEEPDNWLCELAAGEVEGVEHKEYLVADSSPLFATKVWDEDNQDVGTWEFFKNKEEAEKAATHCKAMIEAQEQSHD